MLTEWAIRQAPKPDLGTTLNGQTRICVRFPGELYSDYCDARPRWLRYIGEQANFYNVADDQTGPSAGDAHAFTMFAEDGNCRLVHSAYKRHQTEHKTLKIGKGLGSLRSESACVIRILGYMSVCMPMLCHSASAD